MDRPNIILIMTDQQRFDTIGAWGYDYAITPAMDRLARGGAFLSQCLLPGRDLHCLAGGDFHGYVPAQYRRVQL